MGVCVLILILTRVSISGFETGPPDVSKDGESDEAEDSDFWEGVTKPASSRTSTFQQENQV